MGFRKGSAKRQQTVNIRKWGEGYKVVDNNVIGSVYKAVLYFDGKRLGAFYDHAEAYKARDDHIKERQAEQKKQLAAQGAVG